MLRGFLEDGSLVYCGNHARKIIPNIQYLLDNTTEPLIWICDAHEVDDPEFELFPKHCLAGTIEAQIIPELSGWRRNGVIHKQTINGFWQTGLFMELAKYRPKIVTVVGVCTDICVLYVVAGLRLRGYEVVVPANCVASFDLEMHQFGLKHMEKVLGARVY